MSEEKSTELEPRARLRKALLGTSYTHRSEVVEWNGEKIEVRRISIGRQKAIDKQSKRTIVATDGEGKKVVSEVQDQFTAAVLGIIYSCYVPGSDELIFGERDKDELFLQANDGFIEPILEAISRVNKPLPAPEPGEEPPALKNSGRTPAVSSSS